MILQQIKTQKIVKKGQTINKASKSNIYNIIKT